MRKSLLYKLIIVNAIILGFVLNFLALTLAVWFRGNFFEEKRTQFQNTGQYISKTVDLNKDENSVSKAELQSAIDIASVSVNAQIAVMNKNNEVVYISSNISGNDLKKSCVDISAENMDALRNGEYVEYINDSYTYIYSIMEEDNFLGYINT